MNIIITESQFKTMLNESFSFKWNDAQYKWNNDKEDRGANTSMTTRDDEDNLKYGYIDFLLPKSKIISHNLFNIKSFYITQALKHNKVNRYLYGRDLKKYDVNQKPYDLTSDESIEDFKKYVAKYILKICLKKGYNIDVILTPESSSQFNVEMSNIIGKLFEQTFNKNVLIIPNSLIKTPSKITVDKDVLHKNVSAEIENQGDFQGETLIKKINDEIKKFYRKLNIWKMESQISAPIHTIYHLHKVLGEIMSSRMWEKKKKEYLDDINDDLEYQMNRIKDVIGNDYKKTKYFTSQGKLIPYEETLDSWQIKHLSNGIRQSITHLFSLTQEYDKKYSYVNKNQENIKGVSTFIGRLSRNDKSILIFDDNLSSGATLDDVCLTLINGGVKKENIVVFTLGKVKQSTYYRGLEKTKDN